jgi:CheY-like chemotaxis protein
MAAAVRTVLTVEDDPIIRAELRLILEDAGFAVCAAARDGIEAVELAREHQPDLVLLDLGLPVLDGVSAARVISREHDMPIVALTGASSPLLAEAFAAGATHHVAKPFSEHSLVATVRTALADAYAIKPVAAPSAAPTTPAADQRVARAAIEGMLRDGLSERAIVARLRADFGDTSTSAPQSLRARLADWLIG